MQEPKPSATPERDIAQREAALRANAAALALMAQGVCLDHEATETVRPVRRSALARTQAVRVPGRTVQSELE